MGSIPAGAGGTSCGRWTRPVWGAYDRRRGGDSASPATWADNVGLSPQARGERLTKCHFGPHPGPIPAGAGGTVGDQIGAAPLRAYPRRRGGNTGGQSLAFFRAGLSPQARGEPGTPQRGGIICGPIPAGAGGTIIPASASRRTRAYPRRRGGNISALLNGHLAAGLSPQARGEP